MNRYCCLQIVPALRELDACPDGGCWIWPSITQRSYQTAEILASLLGTGYSRIVPEYSFLDPRQAFSLGVPTLCRILSVSMHKKLSLKQTSTGGFKIWLLEDAVSGIDVWCSAGLLRAPPPVVSHCILRLLCIDTSCWPN